jgi:FAD-dependent oxidoreductase domain-containing protein 1
MKHKIVIAGGGAIGCSIAYFLALQSSEQFEVVVVERDTTYRFASSALSVSSIRQQFSTPLCIQLSQFGYTFLEACEDEKEHYGGGVDLSACGYLFLADAKQAPQMRARSQLAASLGARLEQMDLDTLRRRYPWMRVDDDLAYSVRGLEGEGWFDGYSLMQWYRTRAREAGVAFITGDATRYQSAGERVTHLELADGRKIAGDAFVNATGAWSSHLARSLGVELPIRPRRRSAFVVSSPAQIADLPILIDTSGVYVRREQDRYLCMVSPTEDDDLDDLPLDVNFKEFDDVIWPALANRIPAFEALRIERAWAGYYEYNTIDQNGIVGQSGPGNVYVAAGFSGHGLMHSAGIGRGMAELLSHGEYRTLDLSPLSPGRFDSGMLLIEEGVY